MKERTAVSVLDTGEGPLAPSKAVMVVANKEQSLRPRAKSRKLQSQLADCVSLPDRVLFLDIETTGLSHYHDEITVIGWSFGGCAKTIVKGQDPGLLRDDATRAKALVTFNGIRFDTKFITREFPEIILPESHVDLRYLCRRVGLTGGQKSIENELGIGFRDDSTNMDGAAAVMLWHRYLRGDPDALRKLIHYNRVDIAAMGTILDEAVTRLRTQLDILIENVCFQDWSAPRGWRTLPKVSLPPRELTERR